jgi:uncharacterized protein
MDRTMKVIRSCLNLILAATVAFAATGALRAQEEPFSIDRSPLPKATEPVNDLAGVLDDAVEAKLNQKIKDFKARTNPPVVLAVAIVRTTGGRPIEEYSLAIARGWKIGTMNDDNPGALLLIAVDDRRYFTQVSRDLEDELPDGIAGQIQRQYLVPAVKRGDYDRAVSDTIDAYMRRIEERADPVKPAGTPAPSKPSLTGFPVESYVCCLIVIIVILVIIFSFFGRKRGRSRGDRDRWGGGGFGSGGGWVFLPGSGFGGGSSSSSSSSWGGSSDWGGGSSDWGGFGAGGDFGGGGAGGEW